MQVSSTEQSGSAGGLGLGAPVGNQDLGKTEFLKLLVAQMRNQDPLEPMSNSDFVAQLAQFSNVEQLVSVNEGINILGLQQMGMANAQAASFIGRECLVRSDRLEVTSSDSSLQGAFSLQADAATVEVKIRNSAGEVVRTIDLGPKETGEIDFEWDCRNDNGVTVPPGSYRMDVVAKNDIGDPSTLR